MKVLSGGVSADVVLGDDGLVHKRFLPRLKVEMLWESDPRRVFREIDSLKAWSRIAGPETVPSVLDVEVFGFWRSEALDPTGRAYDRIEVPGLGVIDQLGAPDLPAARFELALGTQASSAYLVSTAVLAERRLLGYLVAPRGTDELDPERPDPARDPGQGRSNGQPPQWRLDPAIYGSTAAWPATPRC